MKVWQLVAAAFLWTTFSSSLEGVSGASLEGVELPEFRSLGGMTLKRHGQGIRSITFFGMAVKVYVAGFYSALPFQDGQQVMDCHGEDTCPLQMDFTFLRSVSGKQCTSAWEKQLDHSVSYHYDGYENDRKDFINKVSNPISNGGTISIQMVGDNTVVVNQGVERGIVPGRNFQRAFLSMWFGSRPVTDDLKANLLHGAVHLEASPVLA